MNAGRSVMTRRTKKNEKNEKEGKCARKELRWLVE
jgi:hypothetical protein